MWASLAAIGPSPASPFRLSSNDQFRPSDCQQCKNWKTAPSPTLIVARDRDGLGETPLRHLAVEIQIAGVRALVQCCA